MFFLGTSAHLFIYLLIPAFIIVCCYCRGVAGTPEVNSALTETVVYKSFYNSSEKLTCFFQAEIKKQQKQKRIFIFYEKSNDIIPYFADIYYSPIIQQLHLRAPPTWL